MHQIDQNSFPETSSTFRSSFSTVTSPQKVLQLPSRGALTSTGCSTLMILIETIMSDVASFEPTNDATTAQENVISGGVLLTSQYEHLKEVSEAKALQL